MTLLRIVPGALRLVGDASWRRLFTVAVVITFAALVSIARADVIGEGDVTPSGDPDLPILGGVTSGDVIVGDTDIGLLTIDIPAFTDPLEAPNVTIGNNGEIGARGLGRVTVVGFAGRRSELLVDDVLIVGNAGDGELNVVAGARVISDVAATGLGTNSDTVIGAVVGSQGVVNVSGFGSILRHTELTVGLEGHGWLEVFDSARVETLDEAFIGLEVDTPEVIGGVGRVTVDGRGSRWDIGQEGLGGADDLNIGVEGRGYLEIQNGGWVRVVDSAFVADEANSYGEVTVTGEDSLWWVVEDMFIGNPGLASAQAQLYVNDSGTARADDAITVAVGGRVDMAGGIILTPDLANSGVIRGYGRIETTGTLVNTIGGDIRNAALTANLRERLLVTGPVENSGIIESIGGEMEFESSVTNTIDGQIFGDGAILRFRGPIVQNGDFFIEDTVVESTSPFLNAANLTVGTGSSFVIGDLALAPTSELDMFLGDIHSELQVTGSAMLDGTLNLLIDDGFTPIVGDSFRILTADNGISGTFSTEDVPELSGVGFDVVYRSDHVLVNVVTGPIISGDFNNDGVVNGADLVFWEQNYGTLVGATRGQGDANADGDVDGYDFLYWQRQTGGPAPASAAAASVPEPTAALLAMIAACALAGRRRVEG